MLRKPVWFLRDGAPHIWIDLRSLMEAMGISYVKWQNAFRAQRLAWKLEACIDRIKRETLLCPDHNVSQVFSLLLRGLGHHASAGRLQSLAAVWPAVRRSLKNELTDQPIALKVAKPATRVRKVNAFCVRQIFKLLTAGHKKSAIASTLRISIVSINKVAAGTYDLDPDGLTAWQETFGAVSAPEASASRIYSVLGGPDMPLHVPHVLKPSRGLQVDLEETS
jgi:hypothetical protein